MSPLIFKEREEEKMADKKEILHLQELAYKARRNLVELCGAYNGSIHMGGDMSMMDVLTCLFQRTRVSKGIRTRPFYPEQRSWGSWYVYCDGAQRVF